MDVWIILSKGVCVFSVTRYGVTVCQKSLIYQRFYA